MGLIGLVPADRGGCGFYRIVQPGERYAEITGSPVGLLEAGGTLPTMAQWRAIQNQHGIDFVLIQRPFESFQREYWVSFKKAMPNVRLIMDFDDLLWNPDRHSSFKATPELLHNLDAVAKICDRITVSTKPMQDAIWQRYRLKSAIIPNLMREENFRPVVARDTDRLRIMWGGSATHQTDLEQIVPVVMETADRYDWHFMGYTPKALEGLVTPHRGVPMADYLDTIKRISPDIGIAPLADIPFNKTKSNIKLLEYGAIGAATVASAVYPYRNSGAALISHGGKSEWLSALRRLEDPAQRRANALASQEYARSFSIERNDDLILNAYSKR